ncbi:MAG: hypothetical protein OEZ22_07820 [Spirochaetia bacterium]|nr:hypothetical protein [Spirochaetia bacterium]
MKKLSFKKKIIKFIEFIIVRLIFFLFSIVPFSLRVIITEKIGLSLYYLSKKYRNKVLENLSFAFPEKDNKWKTHTAKKNFMNLGRFFSEFIQLNHLSKKFLAKWFVVDDEELKDELKDGCIAILGHLGNWEWIGVYAGMFWEDKVFTLAKPQSNPWSNRFIDKIRTKYGLKIIYTNESSLKIFRKIKETKVLGFIADQDAGSRGKFFSFLGRAASTFMGPANFARMGNLPAFFYWSYRDEKKRLVLKSQKISLPAIDKEKYPEKWEIEFTKAWVKLLEEKAKKHPEDYFWVHSRWKTKPKNNDIVY